MKLRELREERAYSIHELADKAGVHYNTVHRIEHGQENAHPRTIRLLAEALAIEPRELRHEQ